MGGVELMEDIEIITRQAKLIEDQRRLFIATINNFKADITYLRGALDTMVIEHEATRYVTKNALQMVVNHLSTMAEMLNDIEYRMKDHE